jgi:6-pyruvoyltetrahydropterin/6-carboxytetrahydropterin synthase
MVRFQSTKIIELGSCAFRQWRAEGTHCRFCHGYRLMAKFWFGCQGLDDKNWVINFGGLKDVKKVLQDQFDHTLCIAKDDPLLEHFKELDKIGGCQLRIMDGVGIEKTAEWCHKAVDRMVREMSVGRCWVNKVEVWEHELNSAIYERK